MDTPDRTADLRFLEANSVRCAAGNLSGFRVCTEDAEPLGLLEGVLIDPATRRVEYYVIDSPGFLRHRHYLLDADAGAIVQDEPRTLQIPARRDQLDLRAFTRSSVPDFSDDDLMRAMFPA